MSQYRKIRAQDPDGAQEVEYNFGRLFHQIGQFFLALWRGLKTDLAKAYFRMLHGTTRRRWRFRRQELKESRRYTLPNRWMVGQRTDASYRKAELKGKPRTISL